MKRTTNICLKILEILLYIFASILFFKGFSFLASDLDGFANQWRIFPIEIAYFLPIYWLFILHLAVYPVSEKKFLRTLFVNGIILASIGLIGIIITSVYLGIGEYFFSDRNFSLIFPIELYVIYILSIAIGAYLIYVKVSGFRRDTYHYEGNKTHKVFASIFRPFYTLLSMYFFGGLLVSLIGGNFYESSGTYFIVYVLIIFNSLSLLYYELVMRNKGEFSFNFSKKTKLIIASSYLGVSIVLFTVLFSLLAYNPNFVAQNFQMLLPLDFMGSLTLFLYLISLPTLGYAIYFFIQAIRK